MKRQEALDIVNEMIDDLERAQEREYDNCESISPKTYVDMRAAHAANLSRYEQLREAIVSQIGDI